MPRKRSLKKRLWNLVKRGSRGEGRSSGYGSGENSTRGGDPHKKNRKVARGEDTRRSSDRPTKSTSGRSWNGNPTEEEHGPYSDNPRNTSETLVRSERSNKDPRGNRKRTKSTYEEEPPLSPPSAHIQQRRYVPENSSKGTDEDGDLSSFGRASGYMPITKFVDPTRPKNLRLNKGPAEQIRSIPVGMETIQLHMEIAGEGLRLELEICPQRI